MTYEKTDRHGASRSVFTLVPVSMNASAADAASSRPQLRARRTTQCRGRFSPEKPQAQAPAP